MGANSLARRIVKRALYPLLNERSYRVLQGMSKAWDIYRGDWSEPELELIPYAVRPGETALDIGANYGLYCYHLSRALGEGGRVYAFEPIPFTVSTLRLVIRLLGLQNIEVIEKGCSDQNGAVSFTLPIQDSGAISAGLAHIQTRYDERPGKEIHFKYQKTSSVVCEVVRLDDFLPGHAEISFVKCDIEGAELLALRGAEKLIERWAPTIVCEINPWFLEGFGISLGELLEFFAKRGYAMYRYDPIPSGARKLKAIAPEEVVEDNYVFLHPRRKERLAPLLSDTDFVSGE